MIMARIYQSTPPEFQAILVGGLCPGAEDVAQCEANLPEFWGMIAALLWPGYWDPSVGLVAHPHTVFTFKCGKENRNLGLVPQFGRMCIRDGRGSYFFHGAGRGGERQGKKSTGQGGE